MNNLNSLTISLLMTLLSQTFVLAQNPLRAAPQDQIGRRATIEQGVDRYDQRATAQTAASHFGSQPFDRDPKQQRFIPDYNEPPKRDYRVKVTGFQEIPRPAPDQKPVIAAQSTGSLLGSAVDADWQDPNRILDLIMKVSLNLVFVLSFAFGVILIAKRWMQPKDNPNGTGAERVRSDSLSILQTLKIDQRISIRLVQWRSNRFLVACDQNGIQSVNTLNDSFDQTLKELDDEVIDDKLVKKLLAGMDLKLS